jgi:predicted NACHT family NTPase
MARTFQSSSSGHLEVLKAFEIQGKTKEFITGRANCSRPTLDKFLTGKPVNKREYQAICEALNLNYSDIIIFSDDSSSTVKSIDSLVQTIRQQVHDDILHRCGKMRILDMEQEIDYGDIYSSVNILEKITGHDRSTFDEMLASCQKEDFDRLLLGKVKEKRVPGLEAVNRYSKLMILGKPGAGKTTFMKRLAMLCNRGEFQSQRVPIFVSLKEFSDVETQPNLLEYIDRQWSEVGVITAAKTLLSAGQGLILLDGLDEVREDDNKRVLKEIKNFTRLYRDCQIVITCRIAAWEYKFEHFTEVEVADFDEDQIAEFINKWFQTKSKPLTAKRMLSKLKSRQPVMELATNPLLLTLLCLIFGNGSDFPSSRSELYEEGLNILMRKWDATRDIPIHQVYKKLSLKRKENLLSQLAFDTFDRGEYFFKQSTVERHITEYIRNIPGTATDEEALQLDSEAVLRSIMAQHGLLVERAKGIFSFSHLTFHEYFAAKRIVDGLIAQGNEGFFRLAKNVTIKRYREVFFLVMEILPDASNLLLTIKQENDGLLASDKKLQEYLVWLDEKCQSIDEVISTKAYLFYISLDISSFILWLNLHHYTSPSYILFSLDLHLNFAFSTSSLDITFDDESRIYFSTVQSLDIAIEQSQQLHNSTSFVNELKKIKQEKPTGIIHANIPLEENKLAQKYLDWRSKLKTLSIKHRNIGHDWNFTSQQQHSLEKYYYANELLKECLESECYIDLDTRKYITDTFCRPLHLIPPRS